MLQVTTPLLNLAKARYSLMLKVPLNPNQLINPQPGWHCPLGRHHISWLHQIRTDLNLPTSNALDLAFVASSHIGFRAMHHMVMMIFHISCVLCISMITLR